MRCSEHKIKGEFSPSGLYRCLVGTQVPSGLLLLPPIGGTQLESRPWSSVYQGTEHRREWTFRSSEGNIQMSSTTVLNRIGINYA